jgi:hypothetical protein
LTKVNLFASDVLNNCKVSDRRMQVVNKPYQNGGLLLVFLSSIKTLPLVIVHGNFTKRHLVGKNYSKF